MMAPPKFPNIPVSLQGKPEKDIESPSSTRFEARFPYHDLRAMTLSLYYTHEALTSLAPHERLPELPVVPSSEACMLGNFGGAIMGAKYRFALQ